MERVGADGQDDDRSSGLGKETQTHKDSMGMWTSG